MKTNTLLKVVLEGIKLRLKVVFVTKLLSDSNLIIFVGRSINNACIKKCRTSSLLEVGGAETAEK